MIQSSELLPSWVKRGVIDLFPDQHDKNPDTNFSTLLSDSEKINRSLRIKLGIDPTGNDIHLGHSILFRKLRAFQDAGHIAVLIIGDFTAQIGDPTGKSTTRVQLSKDKVLENAESYLKQLGKGKPSELSLLDFHTPGRLEVHYNSTWLEKIDLSKVVDLLSTTTVGQMLAKEDFNNRYDNGTPISLHEFLYPLLQGYDSFAIDSDVELGGTDQKFNISIGRDLQRHFRRKPQFGMLLPILVGLDGSQKMSKSLNNYVSINDDPITMYSKLEKVPDNLVLDYIQLLTDLDINSLPTLLRDQQKLMALTVTSNIHGKDAAELAQRGAAKLVMGGITNGVDVKYVSLSNTNFPAKAFYLLSSSGLVKSSSEGRRQIQGGAVRIDGIKIDTPDFLFDDKEKLEGKIIQIGKKVFRRFSP